MAADLILAGGTTVSAPVVMRTAGVPAEVLARLRCSRSYALARALDRRYAWLLANGEALSNKLYAVIGGPPPGAAKPALVGLRRAVFQVRPPTGREWNPDVAVVLPESLAGEVAGWVAALGRYHWLRARLPAVLAAETAAAGTALREVAALPAVQRALCYASPTLFAETAKWLIGAGRPPRGRVLDRLTKYVARAATKTSPFSTFTSSGTGIWTATGPAVRSSPAATVRTVLELNGFLMQRLTAAVCADPDLCRELRVRLNPSALLDRDTVRFLGRGPTEPIVGLPATPAVRACLRILGDRPDLTYAALRRRLDPGDDRGTVVDRFLLRLVELGLIQHVAPVPDLASDPLADLAGWLAAHGRAADAVLMRQTSAVLRSPAPVDDVAAHAARHGTVLAAVDELRGRYGVAGGTGVDAVHETAVATGTVATLGAREWRPALADLDLVRRLLAATDPALPYRLAVGAYCAERFGRGGTVPLLTLHEAVARELTGADPAGRGDAGSEVVRLSTMRPDTTLDDSPLARLRELHRIRHELYELMQAPPDADGVVRVDPATAARLAGRWPAWLTAPASVAFYVQLVDHLLVVNTAHGGDGRGRSRALHLIRTAGGAPPDLDVPDAPGGPLLAEFGAAFGVSLNVRDPVAGYEIDYPYATSRRPATGRIRVNELEVVHDPATGMVRLVANRLRREVRAGHLGMMGDALLPPAARLMARVFGAGYYLHPTLPLPPHPRALATPRDVVAAPRVQVGRVVVRRARWVAPVRLVPVRGKGESRADHLVHVVTWLRAHGVPARFFARVLEPRGAGDRGWPLDKSRKPVYVDVANGFLLSEFDRMLRHPDAVVILDEVLPTPEQAAGTGGRATEFIVELRGPAAGHG